MSQYNFDRTGANLSESTLNTGNVNRAHFGKLFTRTVDDSVYALPLIIPHLPIAGGVHDVLFVATMNNSVYAFDAADATRTQPYWWVNLGTPGAGDSWVGPTNVGILSTPFIETATNTLYVVAQIRNGTDTGLYIHALDIATGQLKYNSPRRMSFAFPAEAVTLNNVTGAIQRAGLLVSGGILYVAVANIRPGGYESQEGFVQSFDAHDLTSQLGTFQATPSATEGKGGIWEAGRGLPADASGVYFSVAGGAYSSTANPPDFGSSIIKVAPGALNVQDWFTPQNWQYLFDNNLDPAGGGVTLIPGTPLLFAGGKEGVIYLLNRSNMGHLEGTNGPPVQRFQAGFGCAQNAAAPDCAQSLGTAYWDRGGDGILYVWDKSGVLRAYHFDGHLFETATPQVGTLNVGMTGGPSVSANGADLSSAIVWAVTTTNSFSGTWGEGTLRAFRADDITQELYNSDINQAADSLGTMTKFAPPVVANGRVYVATQSNSVQVYGLFSGTEITLTSAPAGLTLSVDDGYCSTPCLFHWAAGSSHTIGAIDSLFNPGTHHLFSAWSDGGSKQHVIAAPSTATTYTASFTTQYLLSTNVSGVGGITANPISATGYYDSGTPVQLTAAATGSSTFAGWSGDLSGDTNPQTVTMSAPRTVTAAFQLPTEPATGFLTGFALNSPPPRNNFTGWVGMKLTVGTNPLTVTALGRIFLPGNSGEHTVKFVRASDGVDVPGGTASVSMSGGTAGQFRYVFLSTPVTLQANTAYYLVSEESAGGDNWFEKSPLSSTSVANVNSAVYFYNGSWITIDGPNTSYGPPNFLYSPPPADPNPPFVTGYNLNSRPLRNDFSGWAGMKLTVGASAVTVNALGRIFVSGNTASHVVKLVRASDGTDVPGGSVSVAMAGGASGQFKYVSLGSPVTLQANTAYYLVSQEAAGGDAWYDHGALSTTSVAAVNSSVYFYNGSWNPLDGPNTSYGPPNFLYGTSAPGTIPVTVQTTPSGRWFSVDGTVYTGTQTLNWTPGSTHTIATATQIGPDGTLYVWNTWSDGGSFTHTVAPNSAITYTADFTARYPLITNVVPAGSGSITANPVPTNAYYDSGTVVELTATPNGSNTLANWSGDLTGTANPRSITMSAPRTVTANFQAPAGSSTSFLTGFALNSPPQRNNYGDWVGMKLTVGAAPVTVTALGRVFLTGNSGTHTVKFVRASDGADVPGGSVSVPMAGGTAGQFQYVFLPSPVTLQANTAYYLVSQEVNGGDKWYEKSPLSSTGVATVNSSVYFYNGAWITIDGPNTSYGPPNFLYGPSAGTIPVTVQANPSALSFSVDGTVYSSTQVLNWIPGSTHTIATVPTQSLVAGTRYTWSSWSDSGALSHTVAPESATAYTANFSTQYLLTSVVTPEGSGSITANPISASGYYDSGTSVQLSAAANGSNTFTGWSGDLGDVTNPQSVTMSAPKAVFANFLLPGGPSASASFVTGFALNSPPLRNNFGGWIGMKLTVGPTPLTVTALGRIFLTGNSGTHTVKLVRASDGADVPGGSAAVPMAGGTAGQFQYVFLASPLTLPANTAYYLVSEEVNGGDTWYEHGALSTTGVAAVNSSVYFFSGSWNAIDGSNTSYGPPNLLYSPYSGPPIQNPGSLFVTGYNLNNRPLRNNFTGWVGMKLTVGANPLTVQALGRIFVPGNSGSHVVKFVRASDATDVPGGSASVGMAGGTAGQFQYVYLSSPVTLQANTAYYLVSEEVTAGDTWYDHGTLSAADAAVVNSSVYFYNGAWIPIDGPNTSYGPPSFLF